VVVGLVGQSGRRLDLQAPREFADVYSDLAELAKIEVGA